MNKFEKGMPMWKALGFKTYNEYLESDLWKEKREFILDQLGRICSKCGSKKNLLIHHKTYESVANESIHDVAVLCWRCHEKEYGKQNNSNN